MKKRTVYIEDWCYMGWSRIFVRGGAPVRNGVTDWWGKQISIPYRFAPTLHGGVKISVAGDDFQVRVGKLYPTSFFLIYTSKKYRSEWKSETVWELQLGGLLQETFQVSFLYYLGIFGIFVLLSKRFYVDFGQFNRFVSLAIFNTIVWQVW